RVNDSFVLTTIRPHSTDRPYDELATLLLDLLPLSGHDSYRKLVRSLARHLGVEMALLARFQKLPDDSCGYEGLAMELDGQLHGNFTFDLFEGLSAEIIKKGSIIELRKDPGRSSFSGLEQLGLQNLIGVALY